MQQAYYPIILCQFRQGIILSQRMPWKIFMVKTVWESNGTVGRPLIKNRSTQADKRCEKCVDKKIAFSIGPLNFNVWLPTRVLEVNGPWTKTVFLTAYDCNYFYDGDPIWLQSQFHIGPYKIAIIEQNFWRDSSKNHSHVTSGWILTIQSYKVLFKRDCNNIWPLK